LSIPISLGLGGEGKERADTHPWWGTDWPERGVHRHFWDERRCESGKEGRKLRPGTTSFTHLYDQLISRRGGSGRTHCDGFATRGAEASAQRRALKALNSRACASLQAWKGIQGPRESQQTTRGQLAIIVSGTCHNRLHIYTPKAFQSGLCDTQISYVCLPHVVKPSPVLCFCFAHGPAKRTGHQETAEVKY
jgi:hypothetical protein